MARYESEPPADASAFGAHPAGGPHNAITPQGDPWPPLIQRDGKFTGRVNVTFEAREPADIPSAGIDVQQSIALATVDPDGRTSLAPGRAV